QFGLHTDKTEAVKWLLQATEQGDVDAEYTLGRTIENDDPAKAFEYCLKAAEKGYSGAYLHLGNMYAKGIGTEADAAEAEKWYEKAMDNGNYLAAFYSYLTKNGMIKLLAD
ncbi:sel1 repeat family protein, partial [bacterium]|nr:sel1 repeat family protein [bacterium]